MSTTTTETQLTEGTWTIDQSHTVVSFVVRHVMISKVRGQFGGVSGSVEVAANLLDSKVSADIDLATVNTHDEKRDAHLRSPDFFDVEKFPTMSFASTAIKEKGDDYVLTGDLTLHGVTQPVELDLEFNGVHPDPWGGTRSGFSATTEINRKDFGLNWNAAIESGGVVVGDKVKIELEVELVKA